MRTPFLEDSQIASLPPNAVKVLFHLLSLRPAGRAGATTVAAIGESVCLSRKATRSALRQLDAEKIIEATIQTTGLRFTVHRTARFTYVPDTAIGCLAHLTGRACKALLAICRAASNATGSVRMRLSTIGQRLGRSCRTAVLAIRELRDRGLIDTVRTGRSNWLMVRRDDPQLSLFDPSIAHRSSLLLRLLSTTPGEVLSKVIDKAKSIDPTKRQEIMRTFAPKPAQQVAGAVRRLEACGVWPEQARAIAASRTFEEACGAVGRLLHRHTSGATDAILRYAQRGWLSKRTPGLS